MAPTRSRWPMPATSSAISCRSSATAAPSCSAKSSTRTASAATSSSRDRARRRFRAAATAAPRSGRCCANTSSARRCSRLGIPTTRSLAAVTSGERVQRETMLPGAVLTRVASSHIRVGTFQFFAARGDTDGVRAARRPRHRPALSGCCARPSAPITRCSKASSRARPISSRAGCWSASSTAS